MSTESVAQMRKEITKLSGRTCESTDPKHLRERLAQLRKDTAAPKRRAKERGEIVSVYVPKGWTDAIAALAKACGKEGVSELVRDALIEYERGQTGHGSPIGNLVRAATKAQAQQIDGRIAMLEAEKKKLGGAP